MSDKRIEALTKATEKKKKEALEKTEKAIQTLIKKQHKITIRSVAREANVSVSYIYKYPELAYRIQTLREQQKYYLKPQSPSSKSHQIIATQLRNRIKILEQEKAELTKEIKTLAANVYEMGKSENTVERLRADNIRLLQENETLKEQLDHTDKELAKSREFILTQGYKKRFNNNDINANMLMLKNKVIQLIPEEKQIVTAILLGQSVNKIDDEIQKQLSELGIELNKTLIEEIKNKPREQVMSAIAVVKENIDTGVKVRSKVDLFRSTLKKDWIANESRGEKK